MRLKNAAPLLTVLGLLVVVALPAGAGISLTVTLSPNPAVVGDTVTVTPDQPCPDPVDGMMVEVLVDTPEGSDLILNTTADGAGEWTLDFEVTAIGDYDVIASCIYLEGNVVYQGEALAVTEPSTTSTTSTTTPTVEPTTDPTTGPSPTPPAEPQPAPATFTG